MKKFILFISIFAYAFLFKLSTYSAAVDYSWIDDYCVVDYNVVSSNERYANITSCDFSSATSLKNVTIPDKVSHNNQDYIVNVNGPLFKSSKYIENVVFKSGSKLSSGRQLFHNSSVKSIIFENNIDTTDLTDMASMFEITNSLVKLDFGNLDISRVTDMSSFIQSSSLKEIDFSKLDNRSVTNMTGFYNSYVLDKIKLGNKFNFHVSDRVNGGMFGRGTWVREEDGKEFSAVEIAYNTKDKDMTGTYRKISNISYEIYPSYTTTYNVNIKTPFEFVSKSDDSKYFVTHSDDLKKQYVYYEFDKVNGSYVLNSSDSITMRIPDAVTDVSGNKYDYQFTIDNLTVSDNMFDLCTQDKVYFAMALYNNGLNFHNNLHGSVQDIVNEKNSLYNVSANVRYDVTFSIVDKNGNPVDGSYLFSAYDLDIHAYGDTNNPNLNDPNLGYGLHSEGINFYNGGSFDFDTFQLAKTTSFITKMNNIAPDIPLRVTGSRIDSASEASEFLIKANSRSAKVQFTFGSNAGIGILSYYQPRTIEIENRNTQEELIVGSKFIIKDYEGNEVASWTTTDKSSSFFLNPGKYVVTQISVPDGYNLAKEEVFFVDINDSLTFNGKSVEKIIIYNDKNNDNGEINEGGKCSSKVIDGKRHYYDTEGNEIQKSEWPNKCQENVPTGSRVPLMLICGGIILIFAAAIIVKKGSKLKKI